MKKLFAGALSLLLLSAVTQAQTRWTEQRANDWYKKQPWLVGANYLPSDAINQLEMFQAATWNPALNEHELALGESIGMNTMRVFLQDQLWQQDSAGFLQRLDAFLAIAARHHIRPILVLFDSCWDPDPRLGPQHPPIPGVHNSGWVQSPGIPRLMNPAIEPQLKAYVQGVVGKFANDDRILAWDVWNEPDNLNGSRGPEPKEKVTRILQLLPQVFAWAREKNPRQPLTSAPFQGNWSDPAKESDMIKLQLTESDVITFHDYGWPEEFTAKLNELAALHRPVLCTEYMARGAGSTFDGILPIAKARNIAVINWGLVNGKSQTHFPWDSWKRPYTLEEPTLWFHDVFRADGTPYRAAEATQLRTLTGRGTSN